MTHSIAVIVGSLRKDSHNRRLADTLAQLSPEGLSLRQLQIDDLPLYNQDDDANQAAPVKRLKKELRDSDGVIFVTPEYNRSIPGVLKNAIDHASRPYGDSAFEGKPAGIVGISIGSIGTAVAQNHLRDVLAYLDMPALGQPEMYLHFKDGFFENEKTREHLRKWVERYAQWVEFHARGAGGEREAA